LGDFKGPRLTWFNAGVAADPIAQALLLLALTVLVGGALPQALLAKQSGLLLIPGTLRRGRVSGILVDPSIIIRFQGVVILLPVVVIVILLRNLRGRLDAGAHRAGWHRNHCKNTSHTAVSHLGNGNPMCTPQIIQIPPLIEASVLVSRIRVCFASPRVRTKTLTYFPRCLVQMFDASVPDSLGVCAVDTSLYNPAAYTFFFLAISRIAKNF